MPDQYERRQGLRMRDCWHWSNWQPCTEAEAQRVTGLRSWQVRQVSKCTACGGSGFVTNSAPPSFPPAENSAAMAAEMVKAATALTALPAPMDSYPDQTILHAEGECGNCLQATVAGVLGWPLAAVPHFALLGENHWWDCLQAWLESQGYWIDYQPTSYAAEGGELLPRCWLSGTSPRGLSHAVIGDSATLKMLHDPHPSRAGLVEHVYTIYFFRKPADGMTGLGHETNSGKTP